MIPKKLQIKNFLSYGPDTQTIDFLSYNLICLSGKNGHGKSALLDAMTWALWGQARKTTNTSKADEGLVHLGQKHMLVIFDFEINGTAYRVRREFVKTQSNPFSALDFGIVKSDDTFTTMTDKTIKATQTKLEKTIGITYESFVNSAFLRQGQANEFSKKSPKERKEILATILQLERFEDLKKTALEKSKTFQQQLLQKQSIYDRIAFEITDLQTTLQEQNQVLEQLKFVEEEEKQLQQILVQDEKTKELLLEQHKQYEFLELQKLQYQKQFDELEKQIIDLKKIYEEISSKQRSTQDITKLETEHQQLRTTVTLHQEKLNKRLELKDQYLNLQEKKQAFEKELDQHKNAITQKYEIANKILQEQIEQQKKLIQEHTKQLQQHLEQAAKLTQEINTLTQQHCPLCEQNLSTTHKEIVHQKLKTQIEQEQQVIQTCTIKLDELYKNLEQNQQNQKKLIEHPLDNEKELVYQTLIKKIDVLKQTGQTLAYDKQAHEKDFKQLQDIENLLLHHQTLQKEIAQQEQRLKQINDLEKNAKTIAESYQNIEKQLETIKNAPQLIAEHTQIHLGHKQQMQSKTTEKSNLLNKKSIFDLQSKKITTLQNEQNLIEKELKAINLEISDFAEIIKALGKDGLQALLIEQALPEIEQEANLLLAQLTDNQTQIYIESLRDLKKGGSKETLDIKISDSIGLRPYEMFSGGEAFRIDFALRIAISKLLARRAGTALQTLIIDEGFGSQDDDGLQLIMDSILKIQDNFAKVIIVSHLPSMKEQFPVQFLVQKKASGSTITVIQQG